MGEISTTYYIKKTVDLKCILKYITDKSISSVISKLHNKKGGNWYNCLKELKNSKKKIFLW